MAEKKDFVGVWRLVSYVFIDAGGTVSYPFGMEPRGYIVYTADGYMSVNMMPSGRPNFRTAELLGGSTEEKARAVDTFLSYCGTYDVQGDQVIHHVEVSLLPNWSDGDQRRFYQLDGRRLTLSTAPQLLRGKVQTPVLVWERV